MKSSEAMILAVMNAIEQLRRGAWKIQGFNGVWTRDLAIPVRRSNKLSYEATDVGIWLFVGSNAPVIHLSQMTNSQQWLHSSVGWRFAPVSRGHGFKHRRSPEFFRLLYAITQLLS